MTVKHMKIFIKVFQTKNITQAAKLLNMTQPAVTRAIKEIESYYGVLLFERINHRLCVTEAGKQFYAQALHIADAFDVMEKGLKNWDEFGILRVGATITIGSFMLPDLMAEFQKKYPNLKIKATVSNSEKLQQLLLDNCLDIALIEGEVNSEYLKTEVFAKDEMILILPPNSEFCKKENLKLSDIKDCNFLLREAGSAGRTFLEHIFALHDMTINPILESVSTQAIIKAVSKGLGISILPKQLVKASIEGREVATNKIKDQNFSRNYFIVWHKNKFITNSAKEFEKLCKNFRY